MNLEQEQHLRAQLESDEEKRDRGQYTYTIDALLDNSIIPLSIWPESNENVASIIKKEVDYNSLPFDGANEIHKGFLNTEQQDILLQHEHREALCEAQDMQPCKKEDCELFNTKLAPPVCSEYKIVFEK